MLVVFSLMVCIMNYGIPNSNFSSIYRAIIFLFCSALNNFDITVYDNSKSGEILHIIYILLASITFMNIIIGVIGNKFGEMQ